MFKKVVFLIAISVSVVFLSCSSWLEEEETNVGKEGDIYVAVLLKENSSPSKFRATTYQKLFIKLIDDTDNTVKDTTITSGSSFILWNIEKIPAEKEYKVIAWTENTAGEIIHSPDTQTVVIEDDLNSNVLIELQPRVGSIVMQFAAVLQTIDSFFLSFDSDSGYFETKVQRAANVYLTLDNVPYGARGNLSLKITQKDESLLADWDTLFVFSRENVSFEFSFTKEENAGGMNLSVTVNNPSNTIITGIGDPSIPLGQEVNKGVVITEFSHNYGSQRDFIEITNFSNETMLFDKLTIEIIGSDKTLVVAENVSLLPNRAFVFANSLSQDFWRSLNVGDAFGKLELVSTASVIVLKHNNEVLDYVMYFYGSNSEWIKPAARTSIYLDESNGNPKYNNIPANWKHSKDTIIDDGTSVFYGNPGSLN